MLTEEEEKAKRTFFDFLKQLGDNNRSLLLANVNDYIKDFAQTKPTTVDPETTTTTSETNQDSVPCETIESKYHLETYKI